MDRLLLGQVKMDEGVKAAIKKNGMSNRIPVVRSIADLIKRKKFYTRDSDVEHVAYNIYNKLMEEEGE